MSRRTRIPSIRKSRYVPPELSSILEAMKQTIEIREGLRGDPLDRFVTLREMTTPTETASQIITVISSSEGMADDEAFSFFMG